MTCREVTGFLIDYIAGELPPATVADFERHVFECVNCQAFIAQYRATIAAGPIAAAAEDADPPAELVSAVLETLRTVR